jgi:hypothetical protein
LENEDAERRRVALEEDLQRKHDEERGKNPDGISSHYRYNNLKRLQEQEGALQALELGAQSRLERWSNHKSDDIRAERY